MHGVRWLLVLALLLVPVAAHALQLHWSSGADTLTFADPTRPILVLRADSTEATLPPEWRLLWVGDSTEVQVVELDSLEVCEGDTAQVYGVDGPSTPEDSTAHLVTAHFCSGGSNAPEQAVYQLDLPAWGRGKCKVVALDPSDSTEVLESNEVTFNGGVEDDYPPIILGTQTMHASLEFHLAAIGTGLTQTRGLSLMGMDGSWQTPLHVTRVSEYEVTASAALAANVPTCEVHVTGLLGMASDALVLADPPPPALDLTSSSGCVRRFEEILDPNDPYMIQPKDFAFVPGGWTPSGTWAFHLFYIRQNQRIKARAGVDATEKNIGHAVSNDLVNWPVPVDTVAIQVRTGRFDSQHVWAPCIVRQGVVYNMFYTGVDDAHVQRIGFATSTDLVHWTQTDSILEVNSTAGLRRVTWADPAPTPGAPPYNGRAQLRDPFVMEDPDNPGDWLMYYVTISQQYSPQMVVGVSRSGGDFTSWSSGYPLLNTAYPTPSNSDTTVLESPHAFNRSERWWLCYVVGGDFTVGSDLVWAESNAYSPTDTVSSGARWTAAQMLWTLVPPVQAGFFFHWHASEYLQISAPNDLEYLAGFDDANVGIVYGRMMPTAAPYLFSIECDSVLLTTGVQPAVIRVPRLFLIGSSPSRGRVGFRIELPALMRVHLAVYDAMGRRIRTLMDGALPAGVTDLAWDGGDAGGARAGSGIYFVSMTTADGRHTIRVPLLH